jgi:pilus assembly protein TadC
MLDVGIFEILFDPNFLATAAAAIVVFATIATIGVPLMERSSLTKRLKSVSERREELRTRHHASLQKRATLRAEPVGFMKQTLERFNLANMLESPDTRDKLARAGHRGQAPLIAFMFFRFVMPFIVFAVALIYVYGISHLHWPGSTKFFAALGVGLVGYYLPERSQAFDNLARRTGHPGVKAVATALNQAEHYGTPMGQALRVTAQENREQRMSNAEKKAAALPAKLTVPMILFFLPCLFVVILGPAIMKIMHTMHH